MTPQYFKSLGRPRSLPVSNLRRVLRFRLVQTVLGGFRKEIGRRARAEQPDQIRVFPQPGYQWKKPVAVSKLAGPLVARGFTDLGPYRIGAMPEVTVQFLVNPTVSVYACVYEHATAGIWLDLVSRYEDGSRVTFTTVRSNGSDQRPQDTVVRAPSASSETLYGRMLRERPQRTLLPLDAVTVLRLFDAASAEQGLWRKTEGSRPRGPQT
jgi:hypothetical protein